MENYYWFHYNNLKPIVSGKLKTLEAGCATAYFSIPFAEEEHEVYCIDNDEYELQKGIDRFKKLGLKGNFILMDGFKMGFPDNCFELVFNMGVLEHFTRKKNK